MRMAREWNGMGLQDRVNRASGRALVGISMQVVVNTKRVTHRISGSLARSVHAAQPMTADEEMDERLAEAGTDLALYYGMPVPVHTPMGRALEVGSWMPYACVEWVGRGHPGVTQGLEMSRIMVNPIIEKAFREEGL